MRLTSLPTFLPKLLLGLSIAFLGFIAGTLMVFADAFPATYVTDAYRGGQALISKIRDYNDPYPATLWQPARSKAQGVVVDDPARSAPGHRPAASRAASRPIASRRVNAG